MQVYPNRFESHLQQKGLAPFILLFGDEPQQKLDMLDQVRAMVKREGFDERQTLVADSDFSWSQLIDATQSMSLFSDKQYIELTLPTGKPGAEGGKVLAALAENPNQDTIVLIQGPKIGKDVQKAKWFSALDKHGIFSHCYDLEGKQLQQWVAQRCQQQGILLSPNGINILADACEGNLLAAKQEIEKLSLLFPNTPSINDQELATAIVDQSRFNVFQLIDELLAGNLPKAIKMLLRLESEGIEANIVLWALVKEAQTLAQCQTMQVQQGQINFNQLRIWQNKQGLYRSALSRLEAKHVALLQTHLHEADLLLKSESIAKPFVLLSHLCLMFLPAPLQNIRLS